MDSISSIRGNQANPSIINGEPAIASTQDLRNDDAAVLELSENINSYSSEHLRTEDFSPELKDLNHKIESTLSVLSPTISQQYRDLLFSTINHHERLNNFIKAVSDVINNTQANEAGTENRNILTIGNSVSFSLPGNIEAAFAASINGPVSVRKYAIELGVENKPQQIEVHNEHEEPKRDTSSNTKVLSAYSKNANTDLTTTYDFFA
jgi:hypothetical protein